MPPTLDPERWKLLEPILDDALDLPPEQRGAYLDQACGDDAELRRSAELWLAECESSEDFLEGAGGAYLEQVIEASPFDPSALARVGSRLGPFRLLKILGQGGMGTVFLAERADGQFEQQVAIKVVHHQGLGSDAQERFRFERQILARLEHPNIARLVDGGVDENGAPYLVMEYVDGVPLDTYCETHDLGLEERLGLVADVCRAVSYAHRRQVVHRDLKPSNILVNRSGQVKLLDFGVAELLDGPAPKPSAAGTGYRLTLGFAAPEILRGETATSASDLYSLGVLLFQLITGRLPFPVEDLTFDTLVETVSRGDIPPPSSRRTNPKLRSRLVERELDAVVLKALAKDAADRPSSAEVLAEDLRRLVDGEPVQALPQTLSYLLLKRFQKHRWLWLGAAAAGLLLIFLAGGWLKTRQQAEQKAEIARELAQEAQRIEWFLRYAQALPLHDIRRERDLMADRLRRLEVQVETLGELAEGPGNYALGRGYAQLEDYEKALAALEKAWEGGFRTSGAALAMGKTLGQLYNQRLREAQRIRDPELRAARKKEFEGRYRDRALDFLRQSGSPELESPSYLAGLIAFYDGRFEEAIERAAGAVKETPWHPEGYLLEGDAAVALATSKVEGGEYAAAEASFEKAQEAYAQAQLMAPSNPQTYEGSCTAWVHVVDMNRLRGKDLAPGYERGRAACAKALEAQPDRPGSLLAQALLSIFRLQDPKLEASDIETMLARALSSLEKALAIVPDYAEALQALGTTHLSKALVIDMRRGLDPREDLEKAAAAYRRALELDPGMIPSYSNLGSTLAVQGGLLMARGEDPRAAFDEAIESFRQALERAPDRAALLNNIGNLYRDKGEYQIRRGLDPTESFEASLDACRRALANNPRMVAALNLQGAVQDRLGQLALDRNEDPVPYFQKSIASLEAAMKENPGYFRAAINIGSTRLAWARALARSGEDPRPQAAAGLESLELALELGPRGDPEIYLNRAEVEIFQAQLEALEGRSPAPALQGARETLARGMELSPESVLFLRLEAEAELLEAQLLSPPPTASGGCLDSMKKRLQEVSERDAGDAPTRLLSSRIHGSCAASRPPGPSRSQELSISRKLLQEVPVDAALLAHSRRVQDGVLDFLETAAGTSRREEAREKLEAIFRQDRLAKLRWSRSLEGF